MRKKHLIILIGVLVLVFCLSVSVVASNGSKQVTLFYRDIKVTMNDIPIELKDATGANVEPFIIDGTTYLPVRAIADSLNLNVDWDGENNTVKLSEKTNSEIKDASGFGGIITSEYFDFSIIKAETSNTITNALGITYEASKGKELLLVVFSFKNTTSDTHNIGPSFVSSVDSVSIMPFIATGAIDEYMPLVGAVGAGDTFNAYMIWEVPEGWNAFKFSYLDAETGTASQAVEFKKADTKAR